MLLFYIRHGDPIYNPDMLTPLGKRQAEALGKRLAVYGLDKIFVSSSERARQTAEPTAELLHIEPVVLDWLREGYAWQDLTDLNENGHRTWLESIPRYRALFNSPAMRARGMAWTEDPVFEGTRVPAGIERIRGEAESLLAQFGYVHDRENCCFRVEKPSEERIAVFGHEGCGKAFLSSILDIPYPLFVLHCGLAHSGMSVIKFEDEGGVCYPKLLQLSGDGHLYREGLPTRYCNRTPI